MTWTDCPNCVPWASKNVAAEKQVAILTTWRTALPSKRIKSYGDSSPSTRCSSKRMLTSNLIYGRKNFWQAKQRLVTSFVMDLVDWLVFEEQASFKILSNVSEYWLENVLCCFCSVKYVYIIWLSFPYLKNRSPCFRTSETSIHCLWMCKTFWELSMLIFYLSGTSSLSKNGTLEFTTFTVSKINVFEEIEMRMLIDPSKVFPPSPKRWVCLLLLILNLDPMKLLFFLACFKPITVVCSQVSKHATCHFLQEGLIFRANLVVELTKVSNRFDAIVLKKPFWGLGEVSMNTHRKCLLSLHKNHWQRICYCFVDYQQYLFLDLH